MKWTEAQLTKLRSFANSDDNTYYDLARIFGVSPKAIIEICRKHGIKYKTLFYVNDFWTDLKLTELESLLTRKSNEALKLHFGINTYVLNIGLSKINSTRTEQMELSGYISEKTLFALFKEKKLTVTKDNLLGLRKANYIMPTKLASIKKYKPDVPQNAYMYKHKLKLPKNTPLFYTLEDRDKLVYLFTNYVYYSQVRHIIPKTWLNQESLDVLRIPNYRNVFVHKKSVAFVEDLLTNYLLLPDFSKQVYYSTSQVLEMVASGFITKFVFAHKLYIKKSFVDKVKYSYNK